MFIVSAFVGNKRQYRSGGRNNVGTSEMKLLFIVGLVARWVSASDRNEHVARPETPTTLIYHER